MATKNAPSFLSVTDAAAHLGVHPALIYREIRRGQLHALKIGSKVIRIPIEALEEYAEARSTLQSGKGQQ